jgi:predicted extracellular nuclease
VAQTFTDRTGATFTVVVNHFKSKGSCPSATTDPNADQGDGQGCWNVRRTQEARSWSGSCATTWSRRPATRTS